MCDFFDFLMCEPTGIKPILFEVETWISDSPCQVKLIAKFLST